jgi:hypothetical protein
MRVKLASIGSLTLLFACGGGIPYHSTGPDAQVSPTGAGGQSSISTEYDAGNQIPGAAGATAQPSAGSSGSEGGIGGGVSTPDARLVDAGTPDSSQADAPVPLRDANLVGGSGNGGGGTGGGGSGGGGAGGGGGSRVSSSSTAGTAVTCDAVPDCGGDPAGTWSVNSSCLRANGTADISYLGLSCLTAQIEGSLDVTGTLTLGADGKYTDKTVAKGSDRWVLDPACLILSGTKVNCDGISTVFSTSLSLYGYEHFQCVAAAAGGCTCEGKINQTGGMGLLSMDLFPTGKYRAGGYMLSLGDGLDYSYCASYGELTVMPRPGVQNSTPYTGAVVFQRRDGGDGGAGTGGAGTGGTPNGSGGRAGGGGASGAAGSQTGSTSSNPGRCDNTSDVDACGGDVVGSWDVTSSCLKLSGEFNSRGTGLGCDTFRVTGAIEVTGSLVMTADRKFRDYTTTTGDVTVNLDQMCLWMSGTWAQCNLISVAVEGLGFASVMCADAADGGCRCPGKIKQGGNMGLIVATSENRGDYATKDNTITTGVNPLTGADLQYSYCVAGDKLTLTPKTTSPTTTGSIILQKSPSSTGGPLSGP